MNYWGPLCVLAFFVWLVVYYWMRLAGRDSPFDRRWLIEWTVKGLVLPIVAWIFLNWGTTPIVPPMVHLAPKAGSISPFEWLWAQTAPAIVVISADWAALAMGFFMVAASRTIEERDGFIIAALVFCAIFSPFVGALVFAYGFGGIGFGLLMWFWPVTHYALSLRAPARKKPAYSAAVAKIKFGKYGDAEKAIIEQLESWENDFDGWMMLADLYANHFHDVAEAEKAICDLCDDPATTYPQISVALHRLADWQLKLREDPVAAKRVLEEICKRMPGTHLDRMARLRINHLPKTRAELIERQKTRTIQMPAPAPEPGPIGLRLAEKPSSRSDALARADRCVEKLRRDPNDVDVREELAGIFADQLGQVDLAIEQIELLIEMPEQPPGKITECLSRIASWHLKYRGDRQAAKKLLLRLVREHPRTFHAFEAQRQLSMMDVEDQIRARTAEPENGPAVADNPT